MIPAAYIVEWTANAPWKSMDQVEQDLMICRVLIELFSDSFLKENLAFRGGTAIHKLYLKPQVRYSEDIDLVQVKSGPFGQIADRIQERLHFLGIPRKLRKENNFTLVYRFQSEFEPLKTIKLKVETNCREHFSVEGLRSLPFTLHSSWAKGESDITTYTIEELAGTKLRALYQRSKGRDMFDLYKILMTYPETNRRAIVRIYYDYMNRFGKAPSGATYLLNIENKIVDPDFFRDTDAILSPGEMYKPEDAFKLLKEEIFNLL